MKKLLSLVLASVVLSYAGAGVAWAQELVTTGVVQAVDEKQGVLTVHSDQTQKPALFYGLAATNIFTVDGQPGQLKDLSVGTKVTVQYAKKGQQWYVDKLMFGEVPTAGQKAAAAATQGPMPGLQIRPGGNSMGTPGSEGKVKSLDTTGTRSR